MWWLQVSLCNNKKFYIDILFLSLHIGHLLAGQSQSVTGEEAHMACAAPVHSFLAKEKKIL